jgi:hypothetical protein
VRSLRACCRLLNAPDMAEKVINQMLMQMGPKQTKVEVKGGRRMVLQVYTMHPENIQEIVQVVIRESASC